MTATHLQLVQDTESRYRGLAPPLEVALAYRMTCSPWLWGMLGVHIRPEALNDQRCEDLIRAVKAIAAELGTGPRASASVVQALHRAVADGKLPRERFAGAVAVLEQVDEALQRGAVLPPDAELVAAIAPVLRDYETQRIADRVGQLAGRGEPLDEISARIAEVSQIGRVSAPPRVQLDQMVWQHIRDLRRAERIPLGIPQLDAVLGGGVPRRSLVTFGADMGVGKTATLIHSACAAALNGWRVWYAPMELGPAETAVRVIACLTGAPIEDVEAERPYVLARLAAITGMPTWGSFTLVAVPAGPTVQQLRQAVHDEVGEEWDAGFFDYGDRMAGAPTDRNSSEQYKTVWNTSRLWAEETNKWLFTASQLKELESKKAIPCAEDLAESKWKGRLSTCVIMIWRLEGEENAQGRCYHVAKNTYGRDGARLDNVPTDFARARVAVVDWPADGVDANGNAPKGLPLSGTAADLPDVETMEEW